MNTQIEFTRVNNDVNGNPRYVCHFLELVNDKDREQAQGIDYISDLYRIAINRAHKIGGAKYRAKSYGGGIVFQSYNIQDTEKAIFELLK